MAVRNRGAQAFPFGSATVSSRHIRGGPGLVDENELLRIEIELGFEPRPTALQDIWPILLGRVRGLFLSVTPLRAKKRESAEMLNEWPAASKTSRIWASVASPWGPRRERMKAFGTVRNFVCGPGTMGTKEISHGPTQRACDS